MSAQAYTVHGLLLLHVVVQQKQPLFSLEVFYQAWFFSSSARVVMFFKFASWAEFLVLPVALLPSCSRSPCCRCRSSLHSHGWSFQVCWFYLCSLQLHFFVAPFVWTVVMFLLSGLPHISSGVNFYISHLQWRIVGPEGPIIALCVMVVLIHLKFVHSVFRIFDHENASIWTAYVFLPRK